VFAEVSGRRKYVNFMGQVSMTFPIKAMERGGEMGLVLKD